VCVYRERYQRTQRGVIGMTNNVDWDEPLTHRASDIAAAERANEFWLGWFADPVWL
jgi:beta-glucosidase